MHTHTHKPKKFKQTLAARKLMAAVFWDRKGVLEVEFMQQGPKISSPMYCETLKNCVGPAIQNKRHGMLTYGAAFLHDDACPHTAARTQALLEHFNWELFDYPLYSHDFAPSDYHLFTYLKNWLGSQRFSNNEKLMEGVKKCLSSQATDLFDIGYKNLFPDTTNASVPAVTTLRIT
jgi:hypothetical protein